MNKEDIAMYLVNLCTLMQAQQANAIIPSATLAKEYEKQWGLLKEAINKESDDAQVRR